MSRRLPSVRRRIPLLNSCFDRLEPRALLAPLLYAETDASRLYTVDVATGASHFVANTTKQLTDIAFDESGNLYGVDGGGSLYAVNVSTGATTAIGSAGVTLNALAFAPDGTLYGAGYTGLFAIDPTTGSGRLVSDLHAFPSAGDLTFDASGNLILSTNNASGLLIRVDTSTGNITTLGTLGPNDVYGLSYGPDGTLYAATYGSRQLLSVDPNTGTTSQVSLYSGDQITKIFGTAFLDESRRPRITVTDASATAPISGSGTLDFTATLAYASVRPVSVSFATSDATATSPADYTSTSGTLRFAPGETSKTISVPVSGHAAYKPTEMLRLNLSGALNGLLVTRSATGTIQVPGAAPTVSLSLDRPTFDENGGSATITATLSAATGVPTTVDLGFSGTAISGTNFTADANSILIPAGAISASLTLKGQDDDAIRGPLVATVSISAVSGATPTGTQVVSATETDTTTRPEVSLNSVTGNDISATFSFVVTLSKPLKNAVSVDYATKDGSAIHGLDYRGTSGTLSFSAGQTQKVVQVAILNDPAFKLEKAFSLTLSNPTFATVLGGAGIGTIVNTAKPPIVSVEDFSKVEGKRGPSPALVTIRLSAPSELPVTLVVETQDGSAKAGKDYLPLRSTITFLPGETVKTLAISVLGNAKKQHDRTFFVSIVASTGATVARGQATGTIVDDDGHKRVERKAIGTIVRSISRFPGRQFRKHGK
ncbi:MAG: retention module-containing protein [Planctomycetota bacterium]|nr:retention module-containing protein [Planctomycetota bacterium]